MALNKLENLYQEKKMLFLATTALVSEFSIAARDNWPKQFSLSLLLTFLAVKKSLYEMVNTAESCNPLPPPF